MVHPITVFKDAFSAWEQWDLTNFEHKYERLSAFKLALEEQHSNAGKVASYHLQHAFALLAEPHQLVGPTGETNELYTAGRGVALVVYDNSLSHSENALCGIFAILTCALIAGNSVVICSDNAEFNQLVKHAVASANFPSNLVQVVAYDVSSSLLDNDIRSVGYVGYPQVEHELNLQLAKRDGVIVSLVSETDLESPRMALDPYLSLRFITERTRTINITAVGGNATLLELGSDSH